MTNGIANLIVGALGVLFGMLLFIPALKRNQRIDTESVAVVKEVLDLGRSEGKKVYAIKYTVQSSEPFEILETPCKKKRNPGTERSIFYEKESPKNNYYFKTIGQFDSRLVVPFLLIIAGIIIIVYAIIAMIGLV